MTRSKAKFIALLTMGMLPKVLLYAQFGPTPPSTDPIPEETPPPTDKQSVPVDGGIGLVLAAGVAAYSRKKLVQHKKENVIK
jgi:hypothetical protein